MKEESRRFIIALLLQVGNQVNIVKYLESNSSNKIQKNIKDETETDETQ